MEVNGPPGGGGGAFWRAVGLQEFLLHRGEVRFLGVHAFEHSPGFLFGGGDDASDPQAVLQALRMDGEGEVEGV